MFHVWVGLGLLSGAGAAPAPFVGTTPSPRRIGDPVLDADWRIGEANAATPGARIGTPTARPPGRRIG